MGKLSYNTRRADANQAQIVAAFRALGADVDIVHMVSSLGADIIVGYRGVSVLVEIKDGSKPPSARKLSASEIDKQDNYRGRWRLVQSTDDAVAVINEIRNMT